MSNEMRFGLYRMTVIICGTLIGIIGLVLGYLLVKSGARGEFAILTEVKGVKGFITSISPGLLFAFLGCVVAAISYVIQVKAWAEPSSDIIKARGGLGYYKLKEQPGDTEGFEGEGASKDLNGKCRFMHDRKIKRFLRRLKIMPTDRILELGYGPRFLLERIDNYHVFVTDISNPMIAKVKKRIGNRKRFFISDAGDVPIKKGSFEKVFCSELLENATLTNRVIKEIYRILTDYGQMVLIIPSDKYNKKRIIKLLHPYFLTNKIYGIPHSFHSFLPATYVILCNKNPMH
jgi:hypothetical protein